MTKVEALEMAIQAVENQEAQEIFKKMIDSITKSQEKAKARKQAKASEENEKYLSVIIPMLEKEATSIAQLKNAIKEQTGEELSTQKVSSLITKVKQSRNVTVELVKKVRFYKI